MTYYLTIQTDRCRTELPKRGFALIASLSIMSMMVLIAVALYSIAAVSAKSASVAAARTEAQANAKMALMIAMGELQKTAGKDRAITAPSGIYTTATAEVAKPNTTGVWESWWDFNPSASPNYTTEKIEEEDGGRFKRWLVSTADVEDNKLLSFVDSDWEGNEGDDWISLVGDRSLGAEAPATADADQKVMAGLVPITDDGETRGNYAWHVADESVKARVNIYRDPGNPADPNTTLAEKRALAAGHRPDASVITGPDGSPLTVLPSDGTSEEYDAAKATMSKVTGLEQAELLDQAEGMLKPLRNDITLYSLGVLSNVRGGGLKQDLSSVFEMGSATDNTVPSDFSGADGKLYESTHGITGISDPNWSTLAGYYNSFRNLTTPETDPTYATRAMDPATSLDLVPPDFNPTPVILRVDTIFSLVARPLESMAGWISNPAGPQVEAWDYFLNLIYTPVVVLHNPYNVSLSFYKMEVTFENVPLAFNFMFQPGEGGSFVSRSVEVGDFENLNTMLGNTETPDDPNIGRGNKRFGMSIANWSDALSLPDNDSIDSPVVLKPGQTLICGPVFPANSNYDQDTRSGGNTVGFDWQWDNNDDSTEITNSIKSSPVNEDHGFIPGLGFEINSITIAAKRTARTAELPDIPTGVLKRNGEEYIMKAGAFDNQAAIPLRDVNATADNPSDVTDRFYLEYKVQQPEYYVDNSTNTQTQLSPEFTVTAKIQATASGELVDFANLDFRYQDDDTLQDIFEDRVYRFPATEGDYFTGSEIAAPGNVAYSEQGGYVRPFAIFSASARTTSGGVYETDERVERSNPANSPEINLLKDGRLAGKPFLFHNPSRANYMMNIAEQKLGVHAYEINFQPFTDWGDMPISENRVPALTGNTSASGINSGSYLEIPSGPLQTIADFRRSNAFTTSYLPHFVQPVGNSLLHPLMSANRVIESDENISPDPLLDHSALANHALYDRFYFSTFATRGSDTPDVVFEQFMDGTTPLPSQVFQPYLPDGQTVDEAKGGLFSAGKPVNDAYKSAAEYQMIRGPFNVNSTSVEAWKAVLASMNNTEITTLLSNSDLATTMPTGVPIPGMSLPNGSAIPNAGYSADRATGWNGYREISTPELVTTDSDLERLAEEIVDEVRLRGPFLSMSEFVNRRIGPSGPLTLSGALEAAIAKAEINEVEAATTANSFLEQVPITTDDLSDTDLYNYKTPEASTGNPASGAPGWVNQGDLLRILGPRATVRGDTFVIRVYGDSQESSGEVISRAYAEAVVQRLPEYVDPSDRPSVNAETDPTASGTNQNFGRRIKMVSFRWLSESEI